MVVPVRLFDGTVFDFNTKYILYNTAQPVVYGNETVYPSILNPSFLEDYNIPKYFERSESEHDLVDRVTCVARHSLGIQLGCSPIITEKLLPEEVYELSYTDFEKWFQEHFYLDYMTWLFYKNFIKLKTDKRLAVMYAMSVYGVCGKEAFTIAKSVNTSKLGQGNDEGMNKIHFKHFTQEVEKVMTEKNIQFPQTVTTTIGGF